MSGFVVILLYLSERGPIIVLWRLSIREHPLTAGRFVAAASMFCVLYSLNCHGQTTEITPGQPLTVTLAPGERHDYQLPLQPGRSQISVLEQGIDVSLTVRVGDRQYVADSPTARFALESVWLDLTEASDATLHVSALHAKDVPAGGYRLSVSTDYSPSAQRRKSEELTTLAIRLFNEAFEQEFGNAVKEQLLTDSLNAYLNAAVRWDQASQSELSGYCWHAAAYISGVLLSEERHARSYLNHAADQYAAARLKEHELVARKDIGQSLFRADRFGDAATYLAKLQISSQEESDQIAYIDGVINNELCIVYKELGKFERAQVRCHLALKIFERIDDNVEYTNALHNLAIAKRQAGDHDGAIALIYEVLERHKAAEEDIRYAKTLSLLVDSLYESGDIDAALSAYDQSIKVFADKGLLTWQASALTKYARIERSLGLIERARLHLEKALALSKKDRSLRWEGLINTELAEVNLLTGREAEATTELQRAIEIFRNSQNYDSLITATIRLANAQLQSGQTKRAATTLSQLDEDHTPSAGARAKMQLTQARILTHENKLNEALIAVRQATVGFESVGSLTGQLEAANVKASILALQNRWDSVLTLLESQRKIVRRVGHSLILPQLKARYYSQQQHFYESIITAYARASMSDDDIVLGILNVIEEARATALRAHLEAPSGGALATAPDELHAEYDRARRKVGQLIQGTASSDTTVELAEALYALERVQNRIWRERTTFPEISDTTPITWPEIDRSIADDTAILYLFAGASEQLGLLLEKGERTRFSIQTEQPVSVLIADVLREFRSPNSQLGIRSHSAKALSNALLGPIASRLTRIEKLVVIPDSDLHNLPLAALPHPDSGQPLIMTHELTNVASLRAALRYDRDSSILAGDYRIAAIGDPVTGNRDQRLNATPVVTDNGLSRLHGTSEELRRIQEVFGNDAATIFTGFDANKTLFSSRQLAKIDVLHIAAHGIGRNTTAARSGIFLSTRNRDTQAIDGHLGPSDLFGLQLNARLVVLSGCETSLGEASWSEGPVGIARAFQYAGVPNVVSTLWKIDDEASAELIATFYRSLAAGNTVSAALRTAQLQLMQQVEFRHPFYWAAFQSTGNWSLRWEKRRQGTSKLNEA